MKLKGKIAIVTGGAAGIGFATAKIFLQEGATVAVCDINTERTNKAIAELSALGTIRGFSVDISKKEQIQVMVDSVLSEFAESTF